MTTADPALNNESHELHSAEMAVDKEVTLSVPIISTEIIPLYDFFYFPPYALEQNINEECKFLCGCNGCRFATAEEVCPFHA